MKSRVILSVFTFALLLMGSVSTSFATGNPGSVTILRFHEVTPSIYRGARPEPQGMQELKDFGIKTDLNLDNDVQANQIEQSEAKRLGIRYLPMPMSGFWTPDDNQVNAILRLVNDPANYPLYIHCLHGQDRTGLIVGLYRVFTQHWSAAQAYQEMLSIGFHPTLVLLNHYFEEKTGFDD